MLNKNLSRVFYSLLIGIFLPIAGVFPAPPYRAPFTEYSFTVGKYGGRLALAITSDPKSFNPIVAQETSTTQVTGLIFEGLVRSDPVTLKVEPNLACAWTHTRGGRVWTFTLRRDVYFNDGVQFTADDVVFTFNELIYNSAVPSSSRDIFIVNGKKIAVEKVDDFTVKFTLPRPFVPFLRALSQEILPRHKYADLVKKGKFIFAMGLDTPPKDIVGTGPFRLKRYLPGERIEFEKNPYYWKKDAAGNRLPYLDQAVFVILQSQDTAMLKFLEGELDYYAMRPRDLGVLGPEQGKRNFTVYNGGPSLGENFIVFNQTPGLNPVTGKPFVKSYKLQWFCDRNFRRAISHLIDRKKIVDLVFNGLGRRQYGPLTQANTIFFDDDVVKYDYDPDQARRILRGLGFERDKKSGILEDKNGNWVEIDFYTNADNTQRIQMAALVKTDLEAVGIKINFLPLDFNNLVAKLLTSSDWEMVMIGFTGGIEPYFGKNVWLSTGTLHVWNRSGAAVYPYEREIDAIFEKSAVTFNERVRKKLFDRWQQIVADELPLIHLAVPDDLYAVRDRFGNMYPTPYGGALGRIEYVYVR